MVVDNYESVSGHVFYDEWGDGHFVGSAVGSVDFPDIGGNLLEGINDCAETSLVIAGVGAAAYLLVTEGRNIYEYIGSKIRKR